MWEQGRKLAKVVKNSVTTTYKYNDEVRLSKTVGGVTHSYRYDGKIILSETYTGTTLLFVYDENNSPIGFRYNNDYYVYAKNLQGDIVEIYDNAGNVVTKYVYDAWGNIISITGSLASTVGAVNPFRYRGYYWDSETGFYWLQTRYYDPATGRFINADSYLFENIQGFNLYAYCYNNPVMYVDYDGEDAAAILEQWNQEAANLSQMDGPYLFRDLIAGYWYVVVGCIFAYEAIAGWFNAADDTPTDESDAPKILMILMMILQKMFQMLNILVMIRQNPPVKVMNGEDNSRLVAIKEHGRIV